jgi:transcriptional regulator with XRE-family HTH domain
VKTMKKRPCEAELSPARLRANLSPGPALKTLRELQGMSQMDLARASGVDQPIISALEHDRTSIGVERAKKLARALRVHPAVLAFPDWQDEPASESERWK